MAAIPFLSPYGIGDIPPNPVGIMVPRIVELNNHVAALVEEIKANNKKYVAVHRSGIDCNGYFAREPVPALAPRAAAPCRR